MNSGLDCGRFAAPWLADSTLSHPVAGPAPAPSDQASFSFRTSTTSRNGNSMRTGCVFAATSHWHLAVTERNQNASDHLWEKWVCGM